MTVSDNLNHFHIIMYTANGFFQAGFRLLKRLRLEIMLLSLGHWHSVITGSFLKIRLDILMLQQLISLKKFAANMQHETL